MKITKRQLKELIQEAIAESPVLMPESQIFCDMDGVLVNFGGAVIKLLNDLLDGGQLSGVKRNKGYFYRLRKLQEELGEDWRVQARDDLNIKTVRNFMFGVVGANPGPVFAGMSPWPDALSELWPFLNSTGRTVNLLTAPITARSGAEMTAGEGKILWAGEHLRPAPADIIVTPAKQKIQYAVVGGVPNVLVDDKASTVEAWNNATEAAGLGRGFGVLHTPGGSAATVQRLMELGL